MAFGVVLPVGSACAQTATYHVDYAESTSAVRAALRWVFGPIAMGLFLTVLSEAGAQTLPEGNTGIAARYPSDLGIGSDPSVIFADDFESYGSASNLGARWSQAFHGANLRIATEAEKVFSGGKSLEMTVPKQSGEVSNNLIRRVSPGRDVLFVRYYAKFDAAYSVLGSSHNGATISGKYCCPGVRADGYNKFLVSYEAGREETTTINPGKLNVYVYHPDQRDIWGDHFFPTGRVVPFDRTPGNFGAAFVARPDVTPELDRWYAYELMVKTNTPGHRDGRIAMWLDGKLIADFPNLRLRDTTDLKIDQFTIDLHVHSPTFGVARKWYDNLVAASSYIGPMSSGQARLSPPTNLRIVLTLKESAQSSSR